MCCLGISSSMVDLVPAVGFEYSFQGFWKYQSGIRGLRCPHSHWQSSGGSNILRVMVSEELSSKEVKVGPGMAMTVDCGSKWMIFQQDGNQSLSNSIFMSAKLKIALLIDQICMYEIFIFLKVLCIFCTYSYIS